MASTDMVGGKRQPSAELRAALATETEALARGAEQRAERALDLQARQMDLIALIEERQEEDLLWDRIHRSRAQCEAEEQQQEASFWESLREVKARRQDLMATMKGVFAVDGATLVIEVQGAEGEAKRARFGDLPAAVKYADAVREAGLQWRAMPEYPAASLGDAERRAVEASIARARHAVAEEAQKVWDLSVEERAKLLAPKGVRPETLAADHFVGAFGRVAAIEVAAESNPRLRSAGDVSMVSRTHPVTAGRQQAVIVETHLDALAHYQLKPEVGQKSVYVCLGGLPLDPLKKADVTRALQNLHWDAGTRGFTVVDALGNSPESAEASRRLRFGQRKTVTFVREGPSHGRSWSAELESREVDYIRQQGIRRSGRGRELSQ